MKKKLFSLKYLFVLIALPFYAFAQAPQATCDGGNLDQLQVVLCKVSNLLNAVIPVLIALGVVYFIWGVINYAIAKDEEAKTKGRGQMIGGIIALAVITSVWGLVWLLKDFTGLTGGQDVEVPYVENPFDNTGN